MGRKSLYKVEEQFNFEIGRLDFPGEQWENFDGFQVKDRFYQIVELLDGEKYIEFVRDYWPYSKDQIGEPPRKSPPLKISNPFEFDILNPILKINCFDTNSIINFCNRYGLLNGLLIQKLNDFIQEINEIKKCIELYQIFIKHQNGEITNELVNEFSKTAYEAFELKIDKNPQYHDMVLCILLYKINQKIKEIEPKLFYRNGNFSPGYFTKGLTTVAYYQLYRVIIQGSKFKECRFCGQKFIPLKPAMEYCPLPEKYKNKEHSACENNYNQMVHWARKQYSSGKKTLDEIASMKKRPIEEVKSWIK